MIGGSMLLHGERWASTVDDLRTVRVIKEELERALAEHQRIVDTVKDAGLRQEFELAFAENIERCEAVIATCKARLA